MENILVLGAGLVARPLIRYLLYQPDYKVRVASRTVSKAEKLIANHPRGEAIPLNVQDTKALKELVSCSDLVVSLVPYTYHPIVAEICIESKKPMVTTSYVSDAMRALDEKAKRAGVIILNEMGLDPGIDHMSAMRIIHRVWNNGGRVVSFYSYCGGLPAPEANTNPLGYKLSWSPRGVVLAGRNSARYLKDGKEVSVPSYELFTHYWMVSIEGLGEFEAYPNRDSIPYIEKYGLSGIETMYRGTLRNPGWCDTWKKIVDLGLLDDAEYEIKGLTYAGLIRRLIDSSSEKDLKGELARYLKIDEDSKIMERLEWLGLLEEEPIPLEKGSNLDVLAHRLQEKLQYEEGERDMIILQHEFVIEYPGNHKERILSTLIDFGIPSGDTAMARTVSLPAAIGARLIVEGKISLSGVQIPVVSEIYEPVLRELEKQGISFKERVEEFKDKS